MRARERSHGSNPKREGEVSMEIEGSGGDSTSGGSKKERKRGIRSSLDRMVGIFQVIGMVAAIIVLVGVFFQLRDGSDKALATDSDASIMRRARLEVNYWATHGGEFPTLGLTRGDYSYNNKFCNFCGGDLEFCLAHNVTNTTTPPVELLVPGKLVARRIHEKSLCFLWYSNHVYSRPSGGFDGIYLQRIGGVDSKNGLLDALKRYETTYGCSPFQTYPVSLDLSSEKNCQAFRTGYFTEENKLKDVLWFVKASNGSTGDHIQLVRGDVAANAGVATAKCTGNCRMKVDCPAPDLIASMNVNDIWIVDGKKFDNRAYLLVASVDPLVVFYRMGHLRFSVLDYKGSDDLDFNVHVTNPRFAHNLTNDTSRFIKPFETLHKELVHMHGEAEGDRRYLKLKQSVMNAMLHVVYSVKSVWEHKEMWEEDPRRAKNLTWDQLAGSGYALRWSYGFLALDIAMDSHGNAHVLDLNTGPSFYHKMELEPWFRKERSIMIREAFDILQEVCFKKVYARSHNRTDFELLRQLKTASHWLPLYNQPNGGASIGPFGEKLLETGQCPSKDLSQPERQDNVE